MKTDHLMRLSVLKKSGPTCICSEGYKDKHLEIVIVHPSSSGLLDFKTGELLFLLTPHDNKLPSNLRVQEAVVIKI